MKLGPGSYNPEFNKLLKKSATFKFNKSPKSSKRQEKEEIPGPMAYDPNTNVVLLH